jgi:hypothetical protein
VVAESLTVVYMLAFAVLMGVVLFFVQGKWPLKLAAVGTYFFVASSVYFSFETYKGWPTGAEMDGRVRVLWIEVAEGESEADSSIFLWVKPPSKYKKQIDYAWFDPRSALAYAPSGYPRAFRIPYSKDAAKFADKAKRALAAGMEVEIDMGDGTGVGSDDKKGDGKAYADGSKTMGFDGVKGIILNPSAVMTK